MLGVEYQAPPESRVVDDGKPGGKARANSPWQKSRGLNLTNRERFPKG